jgi:hypothetical protein
MSSGSKRSTREINNIRTSFRVRLWLVPFQAHSELGTMYSILPSNVTWRLVVGSGV